MRLGGYIKTSLIDFTGKIASVVFTVGCNFRCPYCHNSHLVDRRKIAKLPKIKEEEVLADLKRRKNWIEGVVISGGEPTIWPDLPGFIRKIKNLGLPVKLDTNGSNYQVIKQLVISNSIDYIALDFKAPLRHYAKTIGKKHFPPTSIIYTIEVLAGSEIPFELRTTVVPTIHDKKLLVEMAEQLEGIFSSIEYPVSNIAWFLQTFQPKNCLDPDFVRIKPFTKKELEEILREVRKISPNAQLRGV